MVWCTKHKKQRNEVLCTWVFIIKVKSISVHKWITNILSYEHALQYFKSINSFLTFKSGNLVSKIKFLSHFYVEDWEIQTLHKRDEENAQILTKLTGTWKKTRQFLILKWKSDVLAILAALISLVGVR